MQTLEDMIPEMAEMSWSELVTFVQLIRQGGPFKEEDPVFSLLGAGLINFFLNLREDEDLLIQEMKLKMRPIILRFIFVKGGLLDLEFCLGQAFLTSPDVYAILDTFVPSQVVRA